jgi:hypothetical protein
VRHVRDRRASCGVCSAVRIDVPRDDATLPLAGTAEYVAVELAHDALARASSSALCVHRALVTPAGALLSSCHAQCWQLHTQLTGGRLDVCCTSFCAVSRRSRSHVPVGRLHVYVARVV